MAYKPAQTRDAKHRYFFEKYRYFASLRYERIDPFHRAFPSSSECTVCKFSKSSIGTKAEHKTCNLLALPSFCVTWGGKMRWMRFKLSTIDWENSKRDLLLCKGQGYCVCHHLLYKITMWMLHVYYFVSFTNFNFAETVCFAMVNFRTARWNCSS